MENSQAQIDKTGRRRSKTVPCSGSLNDLKRERFCQSRINICRAMDQKNIKELTLPNGVTDSETGNHARTDNGPSSSDSVLSSPSSPFHESLARRRGSSVSLPKLRIPSVENLLAVASGDAAAAQAAAEPAGAAQAAAEPIHRPELIEAAEEGFNHFTEFLMDEIERSGLQAPADLQDEIQSARVQTTGSQTDYLPPGSPTPPTATPTGYKHPGWAKSGKELRKLADSFATTNERKKVQEKAQGVEADSITYHEFRDLLSELFPRGVITRERIVVLFFFCTDLAILALQQNHLELFHRFVRWTLEYIRNKVCTWVANQGGWGAVLSSSVDYLYRGAQLAAAGILIYFAYKLVTNASSNASNK